MDEADEMLKKEFYEQIKCKTEKRQHMQTETDRNRQNWTHESTWQERIITAPHILTHLMTRTRMEIHWENI